MNNQIDLLFALLRSALSGEELSSEAAAHLSEENAALLLPLAKSQDVGQMIADLLATKLPEESEALAKFKKQQMLALFRYESLNREQKEICRVFEEAGIRYMLLKGSVIRPLYPEAYWRTSCDIDILIDEKELDRAAALLTQKLSYKANETTNYHDLSLHSQGGVHLELHFHIKENMENMDRVLTRVWEHAKLIDGTQYGYVQTNEFLLFHVIAHMAYHMAHGGCGIKPFADLFVIEKALTYNRDTLAKLLGDANLSHFFDAANSLIAVWFGDGEHTPLTQSMAQFILKGGLYGTVSNKMTVARGQTNGKTHYLLSRIFMPYPLLKRRYPTLEGRRWLTPFYQVRRWLSILFGGRLKHAKKELQIATAVDNTAAKDATQLLQELKLL